MYTTRKISSRRDTGFVGWRSIPAAGLAAFVALGLVGCDVADDDDLDLDVDADETYESPGDDRETSAGARADTGQVLGAMNQLTIREVQPYGRILTLENGRPVYLFTADEKGGTSSTCYDGCAAAWPPVIGAAELDQPLERSMLASINRDDGGRQITYGGWPLYLYAQDSAGGAPAGQEIESFGGEWYLIGPGGERVHTDTANSGG